MRDIVLSTVTEAYLECAAWAEGFAGEDFTDDAYGQAADDCLDFIEYAKDTYGENVFDGWDDAQIGHDFWLTRNGHGAGFWDRGFARGDDLTEAAKTFGPVDVVMDDDGMLYFL